MANHKDAIKRMHQSRRRRLRNRNHRSAMRTRIKALRKAIEAGDHALASQELRRTVSIVSRLASKRIIHPRQASRRISRLHKAVNALQ